MISHRLTLDYALNPGWMAPFVEGLKAGTALARQCEDCGAVSFPPLRVCTCGSQETAWIALPGTAQIVYRTNGQDGEFGLVRFDGASTQTTLRLVDIGPETLRGRLMASSGGLPTLRLTAESQGGVE